MDKILHVFWKSNPKLLPELVETLEIFYKRIRSFRDIETPHYVFEDLPDALRKIRTEQPAVAWLVIHPVGSYFLDQDAVVYHYQKHIRSQKINIKVGGFVTENGEIDTSKSFFIHLDTALAAMSSPPETHRNYLEQIKNVIFSQKDIFSPLPNDFLLSACYPDIQDGTSTYNSAIDSFFKMPIPETYQQRQFMAFLLLKKLNLQRDGSFPSPFSYDNRKSHIFFFNTEQLIPQPDWIREHGKPLDIYIGTCAGFLDLSNMFTFGYKPQSELIYYDLNPDSILFKKYIWEHFDGNWDHLSKTIDDFCRCHPDVEGFDWDIYPNKTEDIKALFHYDSTLFKKTWDDLRKLPKKFIGVDLIFSFDDLLNQLPKDKVIFFSISDVFLAHNELMWGIRTIHKQFNKLIESCGKFPQLILQGKDPQDELFIGYASSFQKNIAPNVDDKKF